LGGGKENSCSILEAFSAVEALTGIAQNYTYSDAARAGDHICYYSDLSKIRTHYPNWSLTFSLKHSLEEMVASWQQRMIE
jgi:CDP-paratose 2-epimerase